MGDPASLLYAVTRRGCSLNLLLKRGGDWDSGCFFAGRVRVESFLLILLMNNIIGAAVIGSL